MTDRIRTAEETATQRPTAPVDPDYALLIAYRETARLRQERDAAQAERDTLVDAIGGLVSLPPAEIAKAYSVGYGGTAQPTADLRTQLRIAHAALDAIRGAIRAVDTVAADTQPA